MKRPANRQVQIRQLLMRMFRNELALVWRDRVPTQAPGVDLSVVLEDPGDALFDDCD